MANKELEALISIAGQVDPSLQKSVKTASKSFGGIKKAAAATGVAVAAGMTAIATASVAAAKGLYDLGIEFDGAKDAIRIGTGATGEALESLYSDMKEVYSAVPTSMEDASSAIADYNTRLGLSGNELQELSVQAIQVSDMLGEDLSATIESSSQAFQQWGIESQDMSEAMDYIFKVSQSTGTGFNTLMTEMQSYGAQLQEMGFSFEESSALMGQLDKAGVNTTEVLSAMKKSVTALAQEGISASDGLNMYFESIMNAKDATEATTIASEVFGTKAASTMVAAVRDGTLNVEELTATLKESQETISGAAWDTYDFAEKFDLVKQQAQVALEPVATAIFDMVNETMPLIQQAIESVVPIFVKFGEAIVPILQELGDSLFPIITSALNDFGDTAGDFLPSIMEAIKGIGSVIGEVVPIIGGIIQQVAGIIAQIAPIIMDVVSAVIQPLFSVSEAIMPIIEIVGSLVTTILPPLANIISELMPVVTLISETISKVLMVALEAITPFLKELVKNFGEIAEAIALVVTEVMAKLMPVILEVAQAVLPVLIEVLSVIMPVLTEIISAILPVITQLISALAPVITGLFDAIMPVVTIIMDVISAVMPTLIGLLKTIMPVITTVANIISTVLKVAFTALTPVIQGVISVISGMAQTLSATFSGIAGVVKTPINAVIALVNRAIGAVNGISVTVPDWVPEVGGKSFGFNIPTIPQLATGGFTEGISIAGEAGTEAVISFDPAYRKENIEYWAKAGKMLGISTDSTESERLEEVVSYLSQLIGNVGNLSQVYAEVTISTDENYWARAARELAESEGNTVGVLGKISGGGDTNIEYNLGGVTFAPKITIKGSAKEEDVLTAIRKAEPEFFDMLDEYLERKKEEEYAASI